MMAAQGATHRDRGSRGGLDETRGDRRSSPAHPVSKDGKAEGEEDEDEHPHRTRNYAITLAILLALLLAGFFLARSLGYLGGSAAFNLPNVVGQPVNQATTTLRNDGLIVHTQNQSVQPGRRHGPRSQPGGQLLVSKGDTVTLKVAVPLPVKQVPVPQGITNTSLSTAESLLTRRGPPVLGHLQGEPGPERHGAQCEPFVGYQREPGQHRRAHRVVGPGRRVGSLGGRALAVPGRCADRPGGSDRREHLVRVASNVSSGDVIASNPGSGTLVAPGTPINLAISTGPPSTTTSSTSTTTSSSSTTTTTSSTSSTGSGGGHGRAAGNGGF